MVAYVPGGPGVNQQSYRECYPTPPDDPEPDTHIDTSG